MNENKAGKQRTKHDVDMIFLEAVKEAAKERIWKPAELNRLGRVKEKRGGR
jgi:hypothetical protein